MNDFSLLSDDDLYLFNEGSHLRLYDKLGAHPSDCEGVRGVYFAVWAPDAQAVSVVGDFNHWAARQAPLHPRGDSGIWEGFVAGAAVGDSYKYHVESRHNGYVVDKADPFARRAEVPPKTASIVADLDYVWNDAGWLASRPGRQNLGAPISIYELHLGSWRRVTEGDEAPRPMTYREIAAPLAEYVKWLGFTHVEFLPLMEHPFYGSWGYQTTGYFAPTSRYGSPQDLMYLVDYLHGEGIGVILDWVPSHFPTDQHGLGYFDGSHLYEHSFYEKGFHPDWQSWIFNYGRNEVRSFLLSSAAFWLDRYHADGLRVDAVASMLYLDYSRKYGQWMPNQYGGRENLEAIDLLRRLNIDLHGEHPDALIIAEESTSWPMVSKPTYVGGLGFDLKWDMGWMHDTLQYMQRDPVHRHYHHGEITFHMLYAFNENFLLPLSHDEVVHGKSSLLHKMPGDDWQKFANLRLLYAYMYAQPGKKLLFMGGEFAQRDEWDHDASLDWRLTQYAPHSGVQRLVRDLNLLYQGEPALHAYDCDAQGFQWLEANDADRSVLVFLRRGANPGGNAGSDGLEGGRSSSGQSDVALVALNFTPVPRYNYRVGLPVEGRWREVLNTDAEAYGGSGLGNFGGVDTAPIPYQGQNWSAVITLPPLGAVFFRPEPEA
ncbi:MAG TPA: 1,4-alpha-glucan branching protein GlgB [Dehalococcoidia bacterium]|nr:1,4-alpha-glucan branching protein GlgB [Dehalococcoidia bacterium]